MSYILLKREVNDAGDNIISAQLGLSEESDTTNAWAKLGMKYLETIIAQYNENLDPMPHIIDSGVTVSILNRETTDDDGNENYDSVTTHKFKFSNEGLKNHPVFSDEDHDLEADEIFISIDTHGAAELVGGLTTPTVIVGLSLFESLNTAKNNMLSKWESFKPTPVI